MKKSYLTLMFLFLALLFALILSVSAFATDPESSQDDVPFEIAAKSISPKEKIVLNFKVSVPSDVDIPSLSLLLWEELPEDGFTAESEGARVLKPSGYESDSGYYVFCYDGIEDKELGREVYARACYDDGEKTVYTEPVRYSVAIYLYTMRQSAEGEFLATLDTLINRGNAARAAALEAGDTDVGPELRGMATITLTDAHFADGTTSGRFLVGQEIEAYADESGAFFWSNGSTTIADSASDRLSITVSESAAYAPCYYTPGLQFKINNTSTPYAYVVGYDGDSTEVVIPKSYQGYLVKKISLNAFRGNTLLTSVKFPDSISHIGSEAFSRCENLTSITISPEASVSLDYAVFSGCTSLTQIEDFLTGVEQIGSAAFSGCTGLTSIRISSKTTDIGNVAFGSCTNLNSIVVDESNTTYHSVDNCLIETIGRKLIVGCSNSIIPADGSVTTIASSAFSGCSELTNITLPNTITSIGSRAFAYCSKLEKISIPSSVTGIGSNAFDECRALKNVEFESNSQLESIGNAAFQNCVNLTGITVPAGVTSIGSSVFYGCANLRSIELPFVGQKLDGTGQTHFGYIFGASSYSNNASFVPTRLKSVSITGGTSIERNAFGGCTYIESLELPFVGQYADGSGKTHFGWIFGAATYSENKTYVPTRLKSIVVLGGTSVASSAFYGCLSLERVILPDCLSSIGRDAFYGCDSLTYISLPFVGEKADNTGSTSFSFIFRASGVPKNLKTVVITSGSSIANSAFANCSGIESVTLSDSIKTIGSSAFSGCKNLVTVILPNSLDNIAPNAFVGCEKLQCNVYDNACYIGGADNPYYYLLRAQSTSITDCTVHAETKIIAEQAFMDCTSLESITIADKVEQIGWYAFKNCTSLVTVDFAENSNLKEIEPQAFSGCNHLKKIVIPDKVEKMGGGLFSDCTNLEYISLPFVGENADETGNAVFAHIFGFVPQSVKTVVVKGGETIGVYAFEDCSSITSITLPDSVTTIGAYAFSGCSSLKNLTLPENLTSIGEYAFAYCSSVTDVVFPDSLRSIGFGAFSNCTEILSVTLPSNLISVGSGAFMDCSKLEKISIPFVGEKADGTGATCFGHIFGGGNHVVPESLKIVVVTGGTNIGSYAFSGCANLESISLPNSVTSIGISVFSDCVALETISGCNENPYYQIRDNCLIETKSKNLISGCKNSIIPTDGSVISIGEGAFAGQVDLSSIIIPDGITSIGAYAFDSCKELTAITVPNSVESIGAAAFRSCARLADITLPFVGEKADGTGKTYFGYVFGASSYSTNINYVPAALKNVVITGGAMVKSYAFNGCMYIKNLTIPSSVISIGASAFAGCTALEGITLPFVGEKIDGTGQTHFGFVFGAESYSDHLDTIPVGLKSVVITGGESIPDSAFLNCTTLENISIPSSVNSFEESAFSGCKGLKAVYISDLAAWCNIKITQRNSSPLFYAGNLYLNGELITNLSIPDGVKAIGDYTFYGCTSIEYVQIPNSVTSIGSSAFNGCTGVTSITIPSSVTDIKPSAFGNCSGLTSITLPFVGNHPDGDGEIIFKDIFGTVPVGLKSVVITGGTSVDYGEFSGCTELMNIELPTGLTNIGQRAFYGCSGLESMTIPESVVSIGSSAFSGCTSLKQIRFDENSQLSCLEKDTFKNCTGLESMVVPNSVVSIAGSAFYGCTGLKKITLPFIGEKADGTGETHFGYIFGADSYIYNVEYVPETLKSVDITGGTIIASSAFQGCENIEYIDIPNSVTGIDSYAFYDTGLKSFVVPSSVTRIGGYAFGSTELSTLFFQETETWYRCSNSSYSGGTQMDLSNWSPNAGYFKNTYQSSYWYKK